MNFMESGIKKILNKVLYVILGIVLYRIGAHIPVPGINPVKLSQFFSYQKSTLFGLFNMFSGGALQRFTIFSLGIMPYISASIILQLFTSVHPKLAELKKEGEAGRNKISQYTRYATLLLATIQSLGMARFIVGQGIAYEPNMMFYLTVVITLVTGTIVLMWIGEQMTARGIGNGISILIFSGIAANLPSAVFKVVDRIHDGQLLPITALLLVFLVFLITCFVVFMESAQRKVAVHYPRRQHGKKIFAAQKSHLPLKVNMSGVIPPIFASSILLFPATVAQFFGGPVTSNSGNINFITKISLMLTPGHPLYVVFMGVAIIFFCFFYTALVFNPNETAENLKKSGALIPGMRPGTQTAKYIDLVMTRLTVIGSIYLALVSLFPEFLILVWNVPFYFGGTSLLIVVVVIIDFWSQLQSQLMSQQYYSLVKKAASFKK